MSEENKELDIGKLNIRQRMNIAISVIRNSNVKRDGYNKHSRYAYFTPDNVDSLVYEGLNGLELFTEFNLIRENGEITGTLDIIDCLSEDKISYKMASAIPNITATNVSQQLGGAITYTRRYMLLSAFRISDNSADPDAHDNSKSNTPEVPEKPWLNKKDKEWKLSVDFLKTKDGNIERLKKRYMISKKNEVLLIAEAAETI
jgi:hypothetical protein